MSGQRDDMEAVREVVVEGLRKCIVEDGSPVALIPERDHLHISHMVATGLLAAGFGPVRAVEGERDALRSRVVDAAEDAYEIGRTESLTPSSTDALRTWVVRAGFSTRRRDAALVALDAFDAALMGRTG